MNLLDELEQIETELEQLDYLFDDELTPAEEKYFKQLENRRRWIQRKLERDGDGY